MKQNKLNNKFTFCLQLVATDHWMRHISKTVSSLTFGSVWGSPPSSDWPSEWGNWYTHVQPGAFLYGWEEPPGCECYELPRRTKYIHIIPNIQVTVCYEEMSQFMWNEYSIWLYYLSLQLWKSHYRDYHDYFSCLANSKTRVPETWVDGHWVLEERKAISDWLKWPSEKVWHRTQSNNQTQDTMSEN